MKESLLLLWNCHDHFCKSGARRLPQSLRLHQTESGRRPQLSTTTSWPFQCKGHGCLRKLGGCIRKPGALLGNMYSCSEPCQLYLETCNVETQMGSCIRKLSNCILEQERRKRRVNLKSRKGCTFDPISTPCCSYTHNESQGLGSVGGAFDPKGRRTVAITFLGEILI